MYGWRVIIINAERTQSYSLYTMKKPNELRDALEKAIKAKRPAIVDVETDPKRF